MKSGKRLIAIIRSQSTLLAQVNEVVGDYRDIIYSRNPDYQKLYDSMEVPLESVKWDRSFDKKTLMESWNYLKKVKRWDAETLFHVFIVLIETDPIYEFYDDDNYPPLRIPGPPKELKSTVNHPRRKKGLKHKPVTIENTIPFNLQPYLCNKKSVKHLLQRLLPYWPEAWSKVAFLGYDLESLPSDPQPLAHQLDPYFMVHHAFNRDIKEYKLPASFLRYILPALKGLEMKKVREFLAIYWELSLEKDFHLLLMVSRFLSFTVTDTALKIFRVLATRPPSDRLEILASFNECGGWKISSNAFTTKDLQYLLDFIPRKYLWCRGKGLVKGLVEGISLDYLHNGFRLANQFSPKFSFDYTWDCPNFEIKEFLKLVKKIKPSTFFSGEFVLYLWSECGYKNWLMTVIKQMNQYQCSPDVTWKIIDLFKENLDTACTADRVGTKRVFIEQQLPKIVSFLTRIDAEYQISFIENLNDYYFYWEGKSVSLQKNYIDAVYFVLEKMCQPPFKKNTEATLLVSYFIDCTQGQTRESFLNAPVSSFLKLQISTRSGNRGKLVKLGILSLLQYCNEFTIEAFEHFPGKLFKVAGLLGTLLRFQRVSVLKEFLKHPLMKSGVNELKPKWLYSVVKKCLESGICDPIPKKLKEHFSGGRLLTENQLSRALENLKTGLISTRLDILEALIWKNFQKEFPASKDDEIWRHTLQFLNHIQTNRRPIKRFLKAYCEGESDYLMKHANTRHWIQNHKRIPVSKWLAGVELKGNTDKFGEVTIRLEQNPMEVLKMGTYVGSCLGLGGAFSYSAAAVVLDLNKQVLYARDSQSKVLARQLVAISKKNELICFEVYPVKSSAEIKKIFIEYDYQLAKALKIPLFGNEKNILRKGKSWVKKHRGNDEYEIEHILSADWYDDYAWDFDLEDDS